MTFSYMNWTLDSGLDSGLDLSPGFVLSQGHIMIHSLLLQVSF